MTQPSPSHQPRSLKRPLPPLASGEDHEDLGLDLVQHVISTQDSIGNPADWLHSPSLSLPQSLESAKRPRLDSHVIATDPIHLAPTSLSPIRPRNALSRSAFATLSDSDSSPDTDSDTEASSTRQPPPPPPVADSWLASSAQRQPHAQPQPPQVNNNHDPPAPFQFPDLQSFPEDDPWFRAGLPVDTFDGNDMDLEAQLEHEQSLLREIEEERMSAELSALADEYNQFGLPLDTQHLRAPAAPSHAPATSVRRLTPSPLAPQLALRLEPETRLIDYSQPLPLAAASAAYTATSSAGTTLHFPARTPDNRIITAADAKRNARRARSHASGGDDAQADEADDLEMYALVQRLEREVVIDAEEREAREMEQPQGTRRRRRRAEQDEEDQMWVDKYHPQTYMDLIGDESVARQVLAWVRAWDTCVFGTKVPKARTVRNTHPPAASASSASNKSRSTAPAAAVQATYTALSSIDRTPGDPLHRPLCKLLLLAGPPGLGKTTLAHVIARQAGYDVTEINASDDRTARTVHDRIAAAMAGATIHQGRVSRRPRMVVIDEIDGAAASGAASGEGASLVKLLITLAEGGDASKKTKKGKDGADGKPPPGLRRPIICICNDPYAPALRPLRQMAKVVTVYRPDSHVALVRRLAAIALRENLRVSMQSLHWLAASAEGDIRGCLHALQFASRQVRRPAGGANEDDEDEWEHLGEAERARKRAEATRVLITKNMLQKANSASKDGGPRGGLPNVWDAVFSPRAADRLAADLHIPKQPLTALALAMDWLGDFDKFAVGCLEYAIVAHVPEFDRTAGALDQLVVADKLVAAGYRPGLGGLGHLVHSTVPYALALVHAQFRGGLATLTANDPWTKLAAKQATESGIPNHGQARLEYPKSDYEAYVRTRDMLSLIQSMRRAAHPRSAMSLMCLQPGTLATDVFGGPLARILSPPGMRHANRRLMPEAEHQRTNALVRTLSGLGVTLVPDLVEGKQTLRMEPPLEMVCGLTTARGKIRAVLPPSVPVRELLAFELKSSSIRSTLDGVRESIQASSAKVERDFFGRPITVKEAPKPRQSQIPELRISHVRFKFNEGYSNAVRRPVYMRDLV